MSAQDRLRSFGESFTELLRLPRAFWIVNLTYTFDGFAYFGILALLPPFLTRALGLSDTLATNLVGAFAMAVTLFQFGFGSYSERFGVRKALLAAFLILAGGRFLLAGSVAANQHGLGLLVVVISLFTMAAGEGVAQTANYSGLKQYSNEKTSAVGFGLNYAMFNMGIMLAGFASSWIRVGVDDKEASAWLAPLQTITSNGTVAVFLVCAGVTVLALLGGLLFFTRKAEADKLRPEDEKRIQETRTAASKKPLMERLKASPFGDKRFTFFVFILFPARTMFAHQIHTIGLYILRAYPKDVGDKMEWFSNVVNPLVVFVTVPLIAAVTKKMSMVRLMLVGTLVTALPTFLLMLPERWEFLLTYVVIFSLGEALWQPRFYQFAADLAPEGMMGAYMAAANLPWLLAKWTTGIYAGAMLSIFCPENGPRNAGTMWAIYGAFALVSPIGLWMARGWLEAGLKTKHEEAPAAV
jgi:MFS family permease